MQALGQHHVAPKRLQHVLPRPDRMGVANVRHTPFGKGMQQIGHEPVFRPVASADHVAGTGRCERNAVLAMTGFIEERRPVRGRDQFRASLAVAVRVVAAHGFVLAIAPLPFPVLVALVTGHDHDRADAAAGARRLEQVHRAHHVGGIGLHRIDVGTPYQRLGGQVEHHFGRELVQGSAQCTEVAHVADQRIRGRARHSQRMQAGLGGRRQCVASDNGTVLAQPQREPAALEARVPREEDALAAPERRCHSQTFHGARPHAHSSSRWVLSRSVSIGCQKPPCLKAASCPSAARRSSGSRSHTEASSTM
ncbi:hypothetical protein D9M68_622400 [compost metagenome]